MRMLVKYRGFIIKRERIPVITEVGFDIEACRSLSWTVIYQVYLFRKLFPIVEIKISPLQKCIKEKMAIIKDRLMLDMLRNYLLFF